MASLKKNVVGQNVTFCLVNASTGAALTSATFTASAWVTIDNGAQAGFLGTFTTCGNGQYNYAPTQGETNGTDVGIFIAPSGAVPVNLDFHTDVVDGNGLVSVNLVDIAGAAVSTSTAQLGVNVVNIKGTASAGAAGYVGPDWSSINAPTTVIDLSGTTIKNLDGNTVQTGDAFAYLGTNVGANGANLTSTAIGNAIFDQANGIETGLTFRQAMRVIGATTCGVITNAGTTTNTFLGAGVGTTRVTATVDSSGNRSAITLSP